MKTTKVYTTLFNGITDAGRLIEQGCVDDAQAVLKKIQQEAEESFICDDQNKIAVEVTKEEIRDMLAYVLLVHECRDSHIRDSILDPFENKPYYEDLVKLYNEVSEVYFKIGFGVYRLLAS